MNVSAVSNNYVTTQALPRNAESAEVKKAGPDHDGDADDAGGARAAKAPATSTVNLSGQTIGQVISVKA